MIPQKFINKSSYNLHRAYGNPWYLGFKLLQLQ